MPPLVEERSVDEGSLNIVIELLFNLRFCKGEFFFVNINDTYHTEWQSILKRVKNVGGKISLLKVGPPAKLKEIEKIESKLGFLLPYSFRNILLNFSKSVYLDWELPDTAIFPEDFRRLAYGRFGWNIKWIEYDADIFNEMLPFYPLGNGDYLLFDRRVVCEDPPVVYWDHEEEKYYFLSDNFNEYLSKITILKCIEPDYFNLQQFIGAHGLETDSLLAKEWVNLFEHFTITEFDKVANNLKKLINYIVYHRQVKNREIKALQAFDLEAIMNEIQKRIKKADDNDVWPLCWIIGEVVGKNAFKWVEKAWENNYLSLEKRSYLSSRCLSEEEALIYVYSYLETLDRKVPSYTAFLLLQYLQTNNVINWMKEHVSWPVTEGWDKLFAVSNPTWKDIKEWSTLSEVHRGVIVNALYYMIQEKMYEPPIEQPSLKIIKPPKRQEFLSFIQELPEEREFKKRKYLREELIKNVDKFVWREYER